MAGALNINSTSATLRVGDAMIHGLTPLWPNSSRALQNGLASRCAPLPGCEATLFELPGHSAVRGGIDSEARSRQDGPSHESRASIRHFHFLSRPADSNAVMAGKRTRAVARFVTARTGKHFARRLT